ncbi:MAG: HEAT repeat domain-containing protein [Acidimicrobiales bacterium]
MNGAPEYIPEVLPELIAMLDENQDPDVLVAVIQALGHAWTEQACLAVVPFSGHSDPCVRLAAVQAMPGGVDSSTGSAAVASALIDRFHDDDSEVRDWATFGVGSMLDIDSDEIREALLGNIDDPDYDVQCEAVVGLARRKDSAAMEPTIRLLTSQSVGRLAVESAGLLADARFLPALQELSGWWDVDPELLDAALRTCRGEDSGGYYFSNELRP